MKNYLQGTKHYLENINKVVKDIGANSFNPQIIPSKSLALKKTVKFIRTNE